MYSAFIIIIHNHVTEPLSVSMYFIKPFCDVYLHTSNTAERELVSMKPNRIV